MKASTYNLKASYTPAYNINHTIIEVQHYTAKGKCGPQLGCCLAANDQGCCGANAVAVAEDEEDRKTRLFNMFVARKH